MDIQIFPLTIVFFLSYKTTIIKMIFRSAAKKYETSVIQIIDCRFKAFFEWGDKIDGMLKGIYEIMIKSCKLAAAKRQKLSQSHITFKVQKMSLLPSYGLSYYIQSTTYLAFLKHFFDHN